MQKTVVREAIIPSCEDTPSYGYTKRREALSCKKQKFLAEKVLIVPQIGIKICFLTSFLHRILDFRMNGVF